MVTAGLLGACANDTEEAGDVVEDQPRADEPSSASASGAVDAIAGVGKAARDTLTATTPAAEPERPPETLAIIGGHGAPFGGVLTPTEFIYRSPTHAGWYASAYGQTVTSGTRELKLRERPSTLTIRPGACNDPLLSPDYPHGAAFAHDGSALEGCAGPVRPRGRLAGTVWRVLNVGEAMPPPDAHEITTIAFPRAAQADAEIGGTVGCNDAGVYLKLDGDDFARTRPEKEPEVVATQMECEEPKAAEFGQMALMSLYDAESWTRDGDELRIELSDGRTIRTRYLTGAL